MSSTIEEKTLDDIQEIYTVLNKIPNVNLQKVLNTLIENDDYQTTKFNACLEKFICEYASINNLSDKLKEELERLSQFPDRDIYDTILPSLKNYIASEERRETDKRLSCPDRDKVYGIFKKIISEKKFIWIKQEILANSFCPNILVLSYADFVKFYDLVKYSQLFHIKKESSIIFSGVVFIFYY